MIYGIAIVLLVLINLISVVQWRKEKNKKDAIYEKANALLYAMDKSSTSLWKPCLEDTEECIVWNSTEFHTSDDEDDAQLIELDGIAKEYRELTEALTNNY